jgi:peptidoglycan/xylan/chitin deacetylase (PgdA/CDA1 family)
MLRAAMSRFAYAIPVIVILVLGAFFLNHFMVAWTMVFLWLVVMGCGVAIPQMRLFGNFICHGRQNGKKIALTFDDGPDPRSTPQLLELLRTEKIPAVFFGIGKNVAQHPALAARIVHEGHLLENHSYAHSYFTNFYLPARLRAELSQAQSAIENACGRAPKFFRPPVGLSNASTFRVARQLNLQVIGWSIRSLDTVTGDPQKIVARIVRRLEPGAIVLLHDGNILADRLVLTVKLLLANLRERGYEVVRLDKILK